MILYLCVITVSAFAIAVIVTLTEQLKFLPTLSLVWLGVVAVILVDAITACLCRALPMRCANIEKSIFKVGQKEKRFYEKCKIRKWKDLIPEIGHFTGFRKIKLHNLTAWNISTVFCWKLLTDRSYIRSAF